MRPGKWAVGVVCALAIVAGGLGVWYANRTPPLPKRWTEVREGWLYRSAQIPAANVAAVLRDQRINLVVDLTDDPKDPDFEAEVTAARALGVRYLHAPVTQVGTEAIDSYARAIAAIAQAHARGDRVLVHCELGYRRSAAAIALYERLVEHAPPEVAYRELYRYADERSTWQPSVQAVLEQRLPELEARLAAELAG